MDYFKLFHGTESLPPPGPGFSISQGREAWPLTVTSACGGEPDCPVVTWHILPLKYFYWSTVYVIVVAAFDKGLDLLPKPDR